MQFPTRLSTLLTTAVLGLMLGACSHFGGSNDSTAQPQSTPSVIVTTTTAPQETTSPTPSDTTDSDDQDSTTTDSPEPDPTTTGPINPEIRAQCLKYLQSPERADRYREAAAEAGLKVAQTLVNKKRHGDGSIRTFDADGNPFKMPAHYTGWAAIATSDNAFYANAKWKNGQVDPSGHSTQVIISDPQHTPASKVVVVGPTKNPNVKEAYWEAAKPTGDTLRITDLRFFDHFSDQRATIPIPGGGTATLVGPINLGDLTVLDRAALDLLHAGLNQL